MKNWIDLFNFLVGWQPRWFILDYGVLAYYRSQEDVHLGCRGSIKMSCCEILINNADPVRIDLKIPPENFMYLKAATAAERQKWLVALGTAKACLVDSNYEEQQQQLNSMEYAKEKMQELILCRSIMQDQIQQIKSQAENNEKNKIIIEATTLLTATCDSFLSGVQDIMEIIEDNLSLSSISGSPVSTPRISKPPATYGKRSKSTSSSQSVSSDSMIDDRSVTTKHSTSQSDSGNKGKIKTANSIQDQTSIHPTISKESQQNRDMSVEEIVDQQLLEITQTMDSSVSSVSSMASSRSYEKSLSSPKKTNSTSNTQNTNQDSTVVSPQSIASVPRPVSSRTRKSVFGRAKVRFEDVHLTETGLIPTQLFLNACASILPVFDSMGSTTFAPVKMDIQGNINKLQKKFDTDGAAFEYLQNIVFQEIKNKETNARNSATDALLWLKRALEFILVFLSEITKGQKDLTIAADTAYTKSLKKYHGWMVRGVFALAVKACPYYDDFVLALAVNKETGVKASEVEVLSEMLSCVEAMDKIVGKLNSYYRKNKLDSDAVV